MLTSQVNTLLALLTIAGWVFLLALLLSRDIRERFRSTTMALPFAFLIALASVVGSLYYSEIAGYEPCVLCWYQRIAMYPLVLLLGMTWYRREGVLLAPYACMLAGLGGFVALYQYLLQFGLVPEVCSVAAESCTKLFVMTFGYVSLPLMSLTAFALIFASLWVAARK